MGREGEGRVGGCEGRGGRVGSCKQRSQLGHGDNPFMATSRRPPVLPANIHYRATAGLRRCPVCYQNLTYYTSGMEGWFNGKA